MWIEYFSAYALVGWLVSAEDEDEDGDMRLRLGQKKRRKKKGSS